MRGTRYPSSVVIGLTKSYNFNKVCFNFRSKKCHNRSEQGEIFPETMAKNVISKAFRLSDGFYLGMQLSATSCTGPRGSGLQSRCLHCIQWKWVTNYALELACTIGDIFWIFYMETFLGSETSSQTYDIFCNDFGTSCRQALSLPLRLLAISLTRPFL